MEQDPCHMSYPPVNRAGSLKRTMRWDDSRTFGFDEGFAMIAGRPLNSNA